MGGIEMEVGDPVRGRAWLYVIGRVGEAWCSRGADELFYAAAVEVVCEHAIIDKLVCDQVMSLYLPRVFPGEPAEHMLSDARALLAAVGYASGRSSVEVGIGLDFGTAYVGNVGVRSRTSPRSAMWSIRPPGCRLRRRAGGS
jgi:adenylate cyclase